MHSSSFFKGLLGHGNEFQSDEDVLIGKTMLISIRSINWSQTLGWSWGSGNSGVQKICGLWVSTFQCYVWMVRGLSLNWLISWLLVVGWFCKMTNVNNSLYFVWFVIWIQQSIKVKISFTFSITKETLQSQCQQESQVSMCAEWESNWMSFSTTVSTYSQG